VAHTAEILTSSIVVVGAFNPAIFSPDWLERNGLIGESDAAEAREGVRGRPLLVSKQATTFETEWFALQVLANQFSITSKKVLTPAFKDLAVGILQLVPHTPVIAAGLNFAAHFKLSSETEYHRVGDTLAPKDIWDALYPNDRSGLENLTIRVQSGSRKKPVETKDERRISVQPSNRLRPFGAHLSYNDHHDVSGETADLTPAEQVVYIIETQWENAWNDANRVFDVVLSAALGEAK